MTTNTTPCECPMAGFCERHGVQKSAHLHKLCQNHMGYFTMWEDCRGPNQNPQNCKKRATESNETNFVAPIQVNDQESETKLPSTFQMAKNFIGSAADHLANGMKNVKPNQQAERLAICDACPYAVENKSRCSKCGCYLQTKTKWATSSCPIGKW